MNGMKFRDLVLRLFLIAAVVISLVCTWYIWFNPAHLDRKRTTGSTTVKTSTTTTAEHEKNVFEPLNVYFQQNGSKSLAARNDGRIASRIRRGISSWRISSVGASHKLSLENYDKLLALDDSVQMTYWGDMNWQTFDKMYFKKPALKHAKDFKFNRIVFNLRTQKMMLVNDATRTMRRVKLHKKYAFTPITGAISKAKSNYKLVEKRMGTREVAFYNGNFSVKQYTYILDKQGANHYINALMSDGNNAPSSVDAKQLGNQTVYTMNDNNQRLAVDRNDSMMEYENFATAGPAKTTTKVLRSAYNDMNRLKIKEMRGMSYYSYDQTSGSVMFRKIVNGLPIISDLLSGSVEVTHTNASKRIAFSGDNLSVAIPTSTTTVKMPSSQTVLSELLAKGIKLSSITDLQLAYAWTKDSDSSQVVDLVPTYFVQVNGEYYNYQDIVDGTVSTAGMNTKSDANVDTEDTGANAEFSVNN
jgi:regulatory protein YycH of two-component signal transduction system YycFG